jgi:hypothetical protein
MTYGHRGAGLLSSECEHTLLLFMAQLDIFITPFHEIVFGKFSILKLKKFPTSKTIKINFFFLNALCGLALCDFDSLSFFVIAHSFFLLV